MEPVPKRRVAHLTRIIQEYRSEAVETEGADSDAAEDSEE
jgi:hypothetical protein